MSKKQQMKSATRRVKTKGSRWGNFWKRVWNIVCWPFRMIWRGCKWFWRWLCAIDLVGLINLTLITAIVVLIYMLVMDITRCGQGKTPVVDESVAETKEFYDLLEKEELLEAKPDGFVICTCANGDWVLMLQDSTVIRFSHEVLETTEQWPSLAQFIVDAIDD